MGHPRFGTQEIERRGQEWYDCQIRAELEGKFHGKVVVIDIETGDFEVDDSGLAASHRALDRRPGAALYGLRVGYDVVEGFGGFAPQPTKAFKEVEFGQL